MKKLASFAVGFVSASLLFTAFLLLWDGGNPDGPIRDRTIRHAQRIIGFDFTAAEREQMLEDVAGIRRELDSTRSVTIANDVSPAFHFDPLPPGRPFPELSGAPLSFRGAVGERATLPENRDDLAFYTVRELSQLIRSRQITSVELTEFFLDRLRRFDPQLEAVISLTEERAMQQARERDDELARGVYRGPLHGIPWGAKDLLAVEGTSTTWGAMPYRDQVIDETATVVKRLDEAGAVLVAKLSLGALAYGDIWFGGRTNNPWNLEQGSSGSSAGSASATVAGLVPFAIGTETLGSIVSPSIRNGATGLRPTFGRVSRHGAMALSWTMDKIGPITRSVEDAALVFDAIHGEDGLDRSVRELPFSYSRRADLRGTRIGIPESMLGDTTAYGVLFGRSLEVLERQGAELVPVSLPTGLPLDGMFSLLTAEAASAFDELTRSGLDDSMVWQEDRAWPNSFRAVRFFPAVDYITLNRIRMRLMMQMDEFMQQVDMLYTPPFWDSILLVTNLTGHPAVVQPIGFLDGPSPRGATFVGRLYDEQSILEAAHVLERELGANREHPALFR